MIGDALRTLSHWQKTLTLRRNVRYESDPLIGRARKVSLSALKQTATLLELKRPVQDLANDIFEFIRPLCPDGQEIDYNKLNRAIQTGYSADVCDQICIEISLKEYATVLLAHPSIRGLLLKQTSLPQDQFDALLCEEYVWPMTLTLRQLCAPVITFSDTCHILLRLKPELAPAYGKLCATQLHALSVLWHDRSYWGTSDYASEGKRLISKACHFYQQRIHPWYVPGKDAPLGAAMYDFMKLRQEILFKEYLWEYPPDELRAVLQNLMLGFELFGMGAEDPALVPIICDVFIAHGGCTTTIDHNALLCESITTYMESKGL